MTSNEFIEALSKLTTETDWGDPIFGESVLKAELRKHLFKIVPIDHNGYVHKLFYSELVKDEDVMYFVSDGRKTYRFLFGETKLKTDKQGSEYLTYTVENNFPPFAKLVIDYILGAYTFFENKLYDVRYKQFKLIDDFTLQTKYGFKDSGHILEILQGIHKTLDIKPINYIEPYQIACKDFIIDLEDSEILEQTPMQNVSYFKYYDVDYQTAIASKATANQFLEYVIADENSLNNAMLQAYFIAQVSCGIRAKTNFFISKSGVRTGKGLRHIALSGLFNKIDVELDTLKSNGFEALQAWAMFSGGEMALATEQGDIQGNAMERVLKIIATEKTHVARAIGQNQSMVTLSSVLCVDTNRTVALSDEMNGRKVLIQFKDRPKKETDYEREQIFRPYWQAFTDRDKNPKIDGCIGFLLNSLEYFQKTGKWYQWKDVEVFNDIDLDEFQIALINSLQEVDFVQRTDNKEVIDLSLQVYGKNSNALSKAISEIGVRSKSKRVNGRTVRGYEVENKTRFDKYVI
ncbi:hypothetical protein Javan425_0045 [Streptococcus phage Javan425]|uniref:Phage resistance protein n=1 Tax=Streptococcus porcinus str. Jelinkova 176 TaxID=873448 RepID=A0ABN0CUR6_STRPO|nr:hypothetical protein [Streptococcus porcinus]EGJ26933.1 hypothetical protein STRPO_0258 [Streptococcus porcinus str. Jelinkova 176]QBX18360.1 hypothetical protein Javan423_0014 [Streptococcus phage Javan423]QBX18450.1 hypothetical protein Javan425_0045 [Streptococcus phage Javan425]SQG43942.1 bacteriophage resistance protein [Streptococcus porcinus]